MLVRDSMVHRNTIHRQRGRLRAGFLAALIAVAAAGLVVFGLLGPAGNAPMQEGLAPKDPARDEWPPGPEGTVDLAGPEGRDTALRGWTRETLPSEAEAEGDPRSTDAPGWRLSLRVIDTAGQPVVGANVEVNSPEAEAANLRRIGATFELRTSDAREHVLVIEGPAPDREDAAPFASASLRWQPTPDELESSAEVVLQRAARIVGSFHCTDGSSPASAGIDIFHVETGEWSNAAAVEDGTFLSSWMPAGEVIVYARYGSWSDTDLKDRETLILSAGQSHAFHGTLAPAIDLTGTVVDTAGRPLGGVSVRVEDERNPAYSESVVSEEDGAFLCDGLYPGAYVLGLPRSVDTPKTRFEVPRGSAKVDVGHLVFRSE